MEWKRYIYAGACFGVIDYGSKIFAGSIGQRGKKIKSVAIDMSTAFTKAVQEFGADSGSEKNAGQHPCTGVCLFDAYESFLKSVTLSFQSL
jgi:hypothetical protein